MRKSGLQRWIYVLVAAVAVLIGSNGSIGDPARAASIPTPADSAVMETPPALSATATPAPSGTIVKFAGQILDYQGGYCFFTTGDAFRIDPGVKIEDAATGGPTKLVPQTRVYARASFDTGNGGIVVLELSGKKLPDEASYETIKKFRVAMSTEVPNPDLGSGEGFDGKPVPVTFNVEVPAKTPFTDQVYLATDASGWSATAIRMDRVDALHYKVTRSYASGTRLLYRYTRGSWQSADVDQNGLAMHSRLLIVKNADRRLVTDTVNGWQDENRFAPDNGSALPTPFNPVPFNLPPHR
jgi:hypothetical protein